MLRARKMEDEIFEPAAPTAILGSDGRPNEFVAETAQAVREVAAEVGFILR